MEKFKLLGWDGAWGVKGTSLLQFPSGSPLPLMTFLFGGLSTQKWVQSAHNFQSNIFLKVSRNRAYSPVVETTWNLVWNNCFHKFQGSFYTLGPSLCLLPQPSRLYLPTPLLFLSLPPLPQTPGHFCWLFCFVSSCHPVFTGSHFAPK